LLWKTKAPLSTKRRLKRLKEVLALSLWKNLYSSLDRRDFLRVCMTTCIMKRKRMGGTLSPCCTPVSYGMFLRVDLSFSWTLKFSYKFLITSIREGGRPYFLEFQRGHHVG